MQKAKDKNNLKLKVENRFSKTSAHNIRNTYNEANNYVVSPFFMNLIRDLAGWCQQYHSCLNGDYRDWPVSTLLTMMNACGIIMLWV